MYKPDKAAVNIDVIAHSHCKIIKTHEKKEFFSSSSRHARCKVASMKPMVCVGYLLAPLHGPILQSLRHFYLLFAPCSMTTALPRAAPT
jgi:hypothetical protein